MPSSAELRSTLPGRMLAALACSLTIRIFISIPMPQLSSWNSHRCSSSLKRRKGHPAKRKKTTAPDNNPLTEQVALNYHSSHASLMVTLNYYHNKSEKYVTGNRNNYLHCLACMYNRYGVPQEEAAAFIKSQFTDLPADEMDALIGSAYGHNEEFDTRKLNSTQKRMLQIEQHIKEKLRYTLQRSASYHGISQKENGHGATGTFPYSRRNDGNSIWMEMNELGYSCTVKTIQNLIYSDFSITYHPIREYLDSCLNGTERIISVSLPTACILVTRIFG